MDYKYLFGPVPSRRLGNSLGVDLVTRKVCSLNCVYCESGRTTKLTHDRMEYVPYNSIIRELEDFFSRQEDPDYITFSGAGEPTLNRRIGELIQFIKARKPGIPVAVITNGTLLFDARVRKELLPADLVLPSLDAATQEVFEQINRPDPNLDIISIIDGLATFSQEFDGKIWLEVFVLPGYNNDEKELLAIRDAIKKISPERVQLNTLDRPGIVTGLRAASLAEMKQVLALWNLDNAEIIASAPSRKKIGAYNAYAETSIISTISRRPCTVDDLVKMLGLPIMEINKYLDVLESENKITHVVQSRGIFYQIKE
ncbi:MAG: radical SAM protein [Bacteroidales bacterium]|nr:radical SAM protein [Bacteroidales bacterium]MDT8431494.1 radical SAM protein [Bacteroidales bacterium]